VQGNDGDGTRDVLRELRISLEEENISYFYKWTDINPNEGSRIERLAALRNLALQPLLDMHMPDLAGIRTTSENTTVVFLNDVAACPEDILELALQRHRLQATMTCAMDWTYVGKDPTFYDVWIARGMNGDSFFEIPPDGSWDQAWNLLWNHAASQSRLHAHLPFQVFACWNGATAFSAKPVLEGLRFRESIADRDECVQGEPELFCKDLWFRGQGKIAVIPSVNLEYSDEAGLKIKKLKGYTSDLVRGKTPEDERIEWIPDPPEQVKCMPGWDKQVWRPWNNTLSKED
jgi:alpha-1,3-mannosyltransferase